MLKSITLENYTTYIKKTKVDFGATNYKILEKDNTKNGILKGALFVGENASGKTNILKAIRLLIELLASNNTINLHHYRSFYTSKPTFSITYDFRIDGSDITYILSMGAVGVEKEQLIKDSQPVFERKRKKVILTLDQKTSEYDISSISLPFVRQLYFDTHFYDNSILNHWFEFIMHSVFIDCNDQAANSIVTAPINLEQVRYRSYFDKHDAEEANDILAAIGYNSRLLYANSTPDNQGRMHFQSTEKFVSFCKKDTDIYIPEWYESTGNQTLIHVLPAIIYATKHDCMLIVNEFSSGLYNDLEKSLIRYFFTHSKKSQLFFTTHSTNILSNTILRPDQEYSVRFDYKSGGSQISRFSDQSPREAQNIEKMYLNGVFDDVPDYNKNFSA